MVSHMPQSGAKTSIAEHDQSVVAEVDRDGRLVALSTCWDRLVERYEAPELARDRWLGRAVEDWLIAPRRPAWRRLLAAMFSARPDEPPTAWPDETGILRALAVWPQFGADGEVQRLRIWPLVEPESILARPMFRSASILRPLNRAGRVVATAAAAEASSIEDWLASMQPACRLEPFGPSDDDGSLWLWARPALAWADSWAVVLARAVRSGLHDLANPLAGARMLAEVNRMKDPTGDHGSVAEHLEATQSSMQRLRTVLDTDLRRSVDLRTGFEQAIAILGSELVRREVEIDPSAIPEGKGEHPEAALLPLALSLVMAVAVRAAPGDRVVLALVPDVEGWRLEAHALGDEAQPSIPDPAIDPIVLHRLAAGVSGRLVVTPGTRPGRDPEWSVAWSDQSRSR